MNYKDYGKYDRTFDSIEEVIIFGREFEIRGRGSRLGTVIRDSRPRFYHNSIDECRKQGPILHCLIMSPKSLLFIKRIWSTF